MLGRFETGVSPQGIALAIKAVVATLLIGGAINLVRWTLVSWLAFGVLLGPNMCCCALANAFNATVRSESPVRLSCCCKSKTLANESGKGCPFTPHPKGECPCKKGAKKDVVPQTAPSPLESGANWFSKLGFDNPTASLANDRNLDAVRSFIRIDAWAARGKGPLALSLSPILRC